MTECIKNKKTEKHFFAPDQKRISKDLSKTSCNRAPQKQKAGSKRKRQYHFEPNNLPLHFSEFQHRRKRCEYCYKEGFDRKTFVKCTECCVFLCLVKNEIVSQNIILS